MTHPTNDPTYETLLHNRLAKPQMHVYLVFVGRLHTLVEILKYALLRVQLPPPGGVGSIADEYVQRNIINHEDQWRIQKIIEYHDNFVQHNPTHILFAPSGWIDIPSSSTLLKFAASC